MAKKCFFVGMAALVLAFGLVVTGCAPASSGGGGGNSGSEPFSISGSFTKTGAAGDGAVQFDLKSNTGLSRSARAAAEDSYTLSGVLEDGDLTMRLKGSFDPDTGKWSVSAKSSQIIYTIDGSVDSAGNSRGSGATIAVKSGDEWVPFFFPVTEEGVSISGEEEAEDSLESGMPSFAKGTWYVNETGDGYSVSMSCIISDWKIIVSGTMTSPYGTQPLKQDMTLLEYAVSGSDYEVIYCYPEYVQTSENIKKAWVEYLDIDEDDITAYTEFPTQFPSGRWIYITPNGCSYGGFSDAEYAKIRVFWATGGWEKWAATNSVTPQNRYQKMKISYIDNNTKFEAINLVGPSASPDERPWDYTHSYSTLAALKAAAESLVEEHDWSGDEDGGVQKTTFSR